MIKHELTEVYVEATPGGRICGITERHAHQRGVHDRRGRLENA